VHLVWTGVDADGLTVEHLAMSHEHVTACRVDTAYDKATAQSF